MWFCIQLEQRSPSGSVVWGHGENCVVTFRKRSGIAFFHLYVTVLSRVLFLCCFRGVCDSSKEDVFVLLQVLEEGTGAQERFRGLREAVESLTGHTGNQVCWSHHPAPTVSVALPLSARSRSICSVNLPGGNLTEEERLTVLMSVDLWYWWCFHKEISEFYFLESKCTIVEDLHSFLIHFLLINLFLTF